MNIYLRLLKYLRPYWSRLAAAVVCMVFFALTNGALAYLLGPAIKMLFTGDSKEGVSVIPFDLVTIPPDKMSFAVPLAIIVIAVVKGLSSYGNTYYMGYVGQKVISDLRRDLYGHILRLPLGYFTSNPTGSLSMCPYRSLLRSEITFCPT